MRGEGRVGGGGGTFMPDDTQCSAQRAQDRRQLIVLKEKIFLAIVASIGTFVHNSVKRQIERINSMNHSRRVTFRCMDRKEVYIFDRYVEDVVTYARSLVPYRNCCMFKL